MTLFFAYISAVWIVSLVITVYDKIISKTNCRRISEKSLLLTAFIGGAFPMYLTMHLINHKTRHAKFMLLLPLAVFFHIAIVLLSLHFVIKGI